MNDETKHMKQVAVLSKIIEIAAHADADNLYNQIGDRKEQVNELAKRLNEFVNSIADEERGFAVVDFIGAMLIELSSRLITEAMDDALDEKELPKGDAYVNACYTLTGTLYMKRVITVSKVFERVSRDLFTLHEAGTKERIRDANQ